MTKLNLFTFGGSLTSIKGAIRPSFCWALSFKYRFGKTVTTALLFNKGNVSAFCSISDVESVSLNGSEG